MKRILLSIIASLILCLSAFQTKALTPSEKTSDYIIFPYDYFESLSYQKNHLEILPKYFEAAKLHCGTYDKSAFIFYKIDRGYRVYDQYEGGWTGSVRFICAQNSNDATRLYVRGQFQSMLFQSKYNSSELRFEFRETFEVGNNRAERQKQSELAVAEAKRIEAEKIRKAEAEKKEEAKKIETEKIEKEKKAKLVELDKVYGKKCQGGLLQKDIDKNSQKFNDCLLAEEAKTLAIQKQQTEKLALAEEKKQREQSKIQTALQQKKELDQAKVREEQIKVSKMTPDDKRAFTCSEKFGFKKGSDKFKDCVFKIYQAELELEKLELQRELAKANAETARVRAEAAKASEERQQNLARAQAEAATMQAIAARQQAIAANTASSLQMIESGLRMMSPQQSNSVRLKTNCTYIGRDLSCF